MSMLDRFRQCAALCGGILLLGFTLSAHADVIQDANQLFKQKQYDQALKKVDGFLATKPKDAKARFLKGLILTEQDKTGEAIKVFSALTRDYPELPEPYNNLAVLYAGQGEYDKARVALETAIRTHPSYATAHENLGDIYAKMASQAYDRALQLDRSNTGTKTKLALIKELFSDNRDNIVAQAGTVQQPATASPVAQPAPAPAKVVAAPAPTPVKVVTAPAPAPIKIVKTEPAKPVATPAPAKPTPAAPAKAANSSSDVLKAVHGWAAAWSAQNVKQYLGFYADDFKTPHGMSRSAWEAQRHSRLTSPKFIHVKVSDARVKFTDDTHATVTFRENYHASHLQVSVIKTLHMVKSGGQWLIQKER